MLTITRIINYKAIRARVAEEVTEVVKKKKHNAPEYHAKLRGEAEANGVCNRCRKNPVKISERTGEPLKNCPPCIDKACKDMQRRREEKRRSPLPLAGHP